MKNNSCQHLPKPSVANQTKSMKLLYQDFMDIKRNNILLKIAKECEIHQVTGAIKAKDEHQRKRPKGATEQYILQRPSFWL